MVSSLCTRRLWTQNLRLRPQLHVAARIFQRPLQDHLGMALTQILTTRMDACSVPGWEIWRLHLGDIWDIASLYAEYSFIIFNIGNIFVIVALSQITCIFNVGDTSVFSFLDRDINNFTNRQDCTDVLFTMIASSTLTLKSIMPSAIIMLN